MSDKEFEVITAAEEAEGCLSQSITVLYDFLNRWFSDNTPKVLRKLPLDSAK